MVSRTTGIPQTTLSTGTTNNSGSNTSVVNSNSSQSQSGRSSSSTTQNIQNMSSTSLSVLDQLISNLGAGYGITGEDISGYSLGTQAAIRKRNAKNASDNQSEATLQWKNQIQQLNDLASDYSKSAAFSDSDVAVQGALAKALEASMPTITAGIQSAGTSGSAMSALLTQKAAEDAAYNAAELGVNTAIAYGNIAAGALGSAGSLIANGDPAMQQLLSALGIAKGSVEQGTTSQSGSSSSSSTSSGTQTSVNTGNQQTTQEQAVTQQATPSTGTTASTSAVAPKTYTGSSQAFYTPSSYRQASYVQNGNSYSQFG